MSVTLKYRNLVVSSPLKIVNKEVLEGQVESHKEGQHSRVHLTEQQQVAITGATFKVSTSHVNSFTYIQPVSMCFVPFQDSVYMSDVQGVNGQHSVLRMMPSNNAHMI